jgi:hypothetical protein
MFELQINIIIKRMFGCYYGSTGSYLAHKLAQIGVCHGFAVAGDYKTNTQISLKNSTPRMDLVAAPRRPTA